MDERENGVHLEECMRDGGGESCDCVVIVGDVFVFLVVMVVGSTGWTSFCTFRKHIHRLLATLMGL